MEKQVLRMFWLGLMLMLACLPMALRAQQVEIGVNATEITTDQAFTLSVTISGAKGNIAQPNFPEIQGLQSLGNSTSQNWINGHTSITFSRNYMPTGPGTYKIPSISYNLQGKTTQSKSFTLTVKKGTGQRQQQRRNDPFADMFNDPWFGGGQQQQQQPMKYKSLDADYFLSVNLDKETCYIGEQVHGDVVLYVNERDNGKIQADAMAIMEMQQRIKNTGFWQEIIELKEINGERRQANGKNYIAYTLYKNILFPIKTGDIAFKDIYLDGMKLAVAVNASPIARMMRQDMKYENIKIKAADRSLKVLPLPPTKLPDVAMVGKFKLDASLNKSQLNTGENLELEVKIAGNGNIAMMSDPVINFPESFETYEPNTQFNSQIQGNGLIGDKSWKWSMLPARAGDYDLGPLKFYFFDPEKRSYDSLVVPEIKVKVTGEDIENQRIGKSGQDDFYKGALAQAGDGLNGGGNLAALLLATGFVVVAGVVTVGVVRGRKQRAQNKHVEAPADFWNS